MDTQAGLILIIVAYVLNAVLFGVSYLEDKDLIVFLKTKKVSAPKSVSLKFRALRPKFV